MTLLETRLVRIDIPNYTSICCSAYSNRTKIGILTSLQYNDPGNCLLIPMQENLQIIVSSNNERIGSVTFPFTLLNESGCLWLPILSNSDDDYIDALPEELSSPKILLYFEKKSPEELDDHIDELIEVKEKLKTITFNYKEFIEKSKERELSLIKSLEEKENDMQRYIEQLSKAQSRIFSLIAEKKHLSDSLGRMQVEMSYSNLAELREELEITSQELLQSESRNEQLLQKFEDISAEWNFLEEESKHIKESELMTQIFQLKQEVDLKNKEISLLKLSTANNSTAFNDISNKSQITDKSNAEFLDTIKHTKPTKLADSIKKDHLENSPLRAESIQTSMISDEDSILPNSMLSLPCSRGLSPGFKENMKKNNDIEKPVNKGSFRGATISSQNKSRYIPITTSRRQTQSVERRTGK